MNSKKLSCRPAPEGRRIAATLLATLGILATGTSLAAVPERPVPVYRSAGAAPVAPAPAAAPARPPVRTVATNHTAEQKAYATVRSRMPSLKACQAEAARRGEAVKGKATVSFAVSPTGQATDIRVEAPALDGTGMAPCLTATVSRWRFSRAASAASVSFPLLFL